MSSAPKLPKRKFGNSGEDVSVIGLGCMGMSQAFGTEVSDEVGAELIAHALDLGSSFLDTANVYGAGANEILVGKAIAKLGRDKFFLATKFGIQRDPVTKAMSVCGKPEYVKECCEASLKRLGVDTIDLYYLHRVDPNTPIEETVKAMAELVKEGKVRYLGLSEAAASTIRRAHAVHPITAVQSEYSMFCLDPENNGVLDTCKELGVAFVPFSPVGRGFLTGEVRSFDQLSANDFRRSLPRFNIPENFRANLALVDVVVELAKAKGVTASQLALAWLLTRGENIFPIPGTTKMHRLDENFGAAAVKLTQEDLDRIGEKLKTFTPQGNRYSDEGMKAINL
ncbi:Aldo-keto reductase [Hyaloraphidium curvatum]|nr:Aldo-keto reductase [Hyaloraphidium curvatum]